MFLLVFFITSMNNRQMDNQKFINKIFWIHIILSLVFAIVGLLCFIFNLSFSYENAGLELYFGLKDNRLWGFYNPNTGGSVCVISLVFSFILLKQTEKWRKLLYTNIVLQYLYMILTQSRSAWYVFLGIVVLYSVFVIILPVIKKRESINEKLKKVALNVLIILLICVSPTVIKKTIVIFPNTIIEVQNIQINVTNLNEKDYICISDIAKAKSIIKFSSFLFSAISKANRQIAIAIDCLNPVK